MGFRDRLAHAWNVFRTGDNPPALGSVGRIGTRPDRHFASTTNGRTIVSSIYNRIANDAASINWNHVRVDDDDRFAERINSHLNRCLTTSANIDQNARDFKLDVVLSLLDEGSIAIVPVDTTLNPAQTSGYDIDSLRVGKILAWAPEYVQVHLYNEKLGTYQDIWVPKEHTAIIENPFYSVMNAPNSTLKRLNEKLALLDSLDNATASKSLDLIVQLPYSVRGEVRTERAKERLAELTEQLSNSEYGIGYIDATEHVTQLNRPVQNNLMPQIEYLTNTLYAQLGISEDVFNGTASENVMLNYQQRVLEPILSTIVTEMTRKWITATGYTQGQRICYYLDRFKLANIESLGNFMDKASRNEIMVPNEFRSILGLRASADPNANELKNRNMGSTSDDSALTESPGGIDATMDISELPG